MGGIGLEPNSISSCIDTVLEQIAETGVSQSATIRAEIENIISFLAQFPDYVRTEIISLLSRFEKGGL